MVKIPKEQRRYCPNCDKHTDQTLKEPTDRKDSPFRKKFRKRQRKVDNGYGSFPYENPAIRSRGRKNPTSEKKDLEFNCKECGKSYKRQNPIRTSKLEIER